MDNAHCTGLHVVRGWELSAAKFKHIASLPHFCFLISICLGSGNIKTTKAFVSTLSSFRSPMLLSLPAIHMGPVHGNTSPIFHWHMKGHAFVTDDLEQISHLHLNVLTVSYHTCAASPDCPPAKQQQNCYNLTFLWICNFNKLSSSPLRSADDKNTDNVKLFIQRHEEQTPTGVKQGMRPIFSDNIKHKYTSNKLSGCHWS